MPRCEACGRVADGDAMVREKVLQKVRELCEGCGSKLRTSDGRQPAAC